MCFAACCAGGVLCWGETAPMRDGLSWLVRESRREDRLRRGGTVLRRCVEGKGWVAQAVFAGQMPLEEAAQRIEALEDERDRALGREPCKPGSARQKRLYVCVIALTEGVMRTHPRADAAEFMGALRERYRRRFGEEYREPRGHPVPPWIARAPLRAPAAGKREVQGW